MAIDLNKLSIWLLLIVGIVLFVPAIYDILSDLTVGEPWIQIFLGLLSSLVAVIILLRKPKKSRK